MEDSGPDNLSNWDVEDCIQKPGRQDRLHSETSTSNHLIDSIRGEITDETTSNELIGLVQFLLDQLESRGVESCLLRQGPDSRLGQQGSFKGLAYLTEQDGFTRGFEKFVKDSSESNPGERNCDIDTAERLDTVTIDNCEVDSPAIAGARTEEPVDRTSSTRQTRSKTVKLIVQRRKSSIQIKCDKVKSCSSTRKVDYIVDSKTVHKKNVKAVASNVKKKVVKKRNISEKANMDVKKQKIAEAGKTISILKPLGQNKLILKDDSGSCIESSDSCAKSDKDSDKKTEFKQEIQLVECLVCHKMFEDNQEYQEHMLTECSTVDGGNQIDDNPEVKTKPDAKTLTKKIHVLVIPNKEVVCAKCGKTFESNMKHNRHISNGECEVNDIDTTAVETGGKHECGMCHKMFPKSSYLKIHLTVCSKPEPVGVHLKPVDMMVEFENIRSIYSSPSSSVKCLICKRSYSSLRELIRHVIKQHDFVYTCYICKEIIHSRSAVKSHVDSHAKHEELDKNGYLSQLETQTTINNKLFNKCGDCGALFKGLWMLRRHIQKHLLETFPCTTCKRKFISQNMLELHERSHIKNFSCSVDGCSKSFAKEAIYQRHLETHKVKRFLCNICGKVFPSTGKLKTHSRYHTTERNFACETCGCKFKTRDVLSKHVRIHKSTRHYYCEVCGQGFNQSGAIQRHMAMHNDIKAYKCNICGVAYRHRISLHGHRLRTGHQMEGEKDNFKVVDCPVCGKQFVGGTRKSMTRHMLIHTGEKPFHCNVCERSFNDKSNLKHHLMIHDDNRPFGCKLCQKRYTHNRSLRKHMESHEADINKKFNIHKHDEALAETDTDDCKEAASLILGLGQGISVMNETVPNRYYVSDGSQTTGAVEYVLLQMPKCSEITNTLPENSDKHVEQVGDMYNDKKDDLGRLYEYKNFPDIVGNQHGFVLAPGRSFITPQGQRRVIQSIEPIDCSTDQSPVANWPVNVLVSGVDGAAGGVVGGGEIQRALQYPCIRDYLTATPLMMPNGQPVTEPDKHVI